MFPGPGAQIYRNEAGEPLGWDYPSDEPYEPDDDFSTGAADAASEDAYDYGQMDAEEGRPANTTHSSNKWVQQCYNEGYADATPTEQEDEQ